MATLHRPKLDVPDRSPVDDRLPGANGKGRGLLVSVKGRSPEVLGMCSHYLEGARVLELGDTERSAIDLASERMAGQALRVLGFAFARREEGSAGSARFTLEGARDLIWLGLVGMSDPPRAGMREVLARFHSAGVRTVMITGDQSATAHAIGKSIGLSAEWIGYSDREEEGRFKWREGDVGAFTFWDKKQPNDRSCNEDCVALREDRKGRWHDTPCNQHRPFICAAAAPEQARTVEAAEEKRSSRAD